MLHPSRRRFLQASLSATAGLATLSAAGYARIRGANERINFGLVGLGVKGGGHLKSLLPEREKLNIEVVQICDVYRKRAEKAAHSAGAQAKSTQNYEDLLDNKDVHVVLNATPDHWHAKIAIDAIKAGKHVYLEKPMCHTIEQALELLKVEQENKGKVRVQVGVQGAGSKLMEKVRDHLKKNGIGKLVMVNTGRSGNSTAGPWRDWGDWENIDPKTAGLDWDKWLGHKHTCAGQQLAPKRDWDPKRFFQFRCYWDYSGGMATDLFFHSLTPVILACGLDFPDRVVAAGGIWVFNRNHQIPKEHGGGADDREVPDVYSSLIDYPGGPTVTLVGSQANSTTVPDIIAGHDATIKFNIRLGEAVVEPQNTGRIKEQIVLKSEPLAPLRLHENLLEACRDPKVELLCPVSLALRANVAITLGVKSYRERKVYGWDAKRNQAIAGG